MFYDVEEFWVDLLERGVEDLGPSDVGAGAVGLEFVVVIIIGDGLS